MALLGLTGECCISHWAIRFYERVSLPLAPLQYPVPPHYTDGSGGGNNGRDGHTHAHTTYQFFEKPEACLMVEGPGGVD